MPEENTGIIIVTKGSKRNLNSEYQVCMRTNSRSGYKKKWLVNIFNTILIRFYVKRSKQNRIPAIKVKKIMKYTFDYLVHICTRQLLFYFQTFSWFYNITSCKNSFY